MANGRVRGWRAMAMLLAGGLVLFGAGCGKDDSDSSSASVDDILGLKVTTPEASGDAGTITWAVYRPVQTIDPTQVFDYPDNTAVTALCESLLKQSPDGSVSSGLAEASYTDDTTLVLDINPDARFWNGDPVTAEDAVYSMERQANPETGLFYIGAFSQVKNMEATDADTVTIKLNAPDYWLEGELSQMPGIVYQKKFAEQAGTAFGTADAGTMCTGPYEIDDWKAGGVLAMKASEDYWGGDGAVSGKLELRAAADDAALTSALLTGEISGVYPPGALATLNQLENDSAVTVQQGPSMATEAYVVSNLQGVLKDVKVREALSVALDREAYIQNAYQGAAILPRTPANVGNWGYAREVFEDDWNSREDPVQDVEAGKQLVQQAGAEGETLTIGMSNEIGAIAGAANLMKQAASEVGINAEFKAVSANDFINFFIDPNARADVDMFPTVNYPDYADPALFYYTMAHPDGPTNYSGYDDIAITQTLNEARQTEDPDARAELVTKVGGMIQEKLPFITSVLPNVVAIQADGLTGAPSSFVYMGGPWANGIGSSE